MFTHQEVIQSQLPYPIQSYLLSDSLIIVVVDDNKSHTEGDHSLDRNVYGFNMDGTLKWQIQAAPGGEDYPKPFTSVKLVDGKVIAYNWMGTDYIVDFEDGSLHMYGQLRRPW